MIIIIIIRRDCSSRKHDAIMVNLDQVAEEDQKLLLIFHLVKVPPLYLVEYSREIAQDEASRGEVQVESHKARETLNPEIRAQDHISHNTRKDKQGLCLIVSCRGENC